MRSQYADEVDITPVLITAIATIDGSGRTAIGGKLAATVAGNEHSTLGSGSAAIGGRLDATVAGMAQTTLGRGNVAICGSRVATVADR